MSLQFQEVNPWMLWKKSWSKKQTSSVAREKDRASKETRKSFSSSFQWPRSHVRLESVVSITCRENYSKWNTQIYTSISIWVDSYSTVDGWNAQPVEVGS